MPEAIHFAGEILGGLGGADFSGLSHHEIQFSLRQVIELLQFQFPVEQMAAKPFAILFLERDVLAQGASLRGCNSV